MFENNFNLRNSKKELFDKGWTIIKNVFDISEIDNLRIAAKNFKSNSKILDADILSNPDFGHLIYDKRIIKIAEKLLTGSITYFGEGRLLVESINGRKGGAFHRDNPDRDDPNGPDWGSNYDVIRIGIYLEDHKNHSEGLGLLSGSNKNQEVGPGRRFVLMENAPMQKGDILVWQLTTMHVGYPKKLKFFKNSNVALARGSKAIQNNIYKLNNTIYKYLPSFLTLPHGEERIIVHAVFGKTGSPHTTRYIEYCKKRLFALKRWENTEYPQDVKNKMEASRINFIDMSNYKNDNDENDNNFGHFQLPY